MFSQRYSDPTATIDLTNSGGAYDSDLIQTANTDPNIQYNRRMC